MQVKMFKKCSLAMAILLGSSFASAEGVVDGWSGKGEAGITAVSGNSDSETVTANLEFAKTVGLWDHSVKLAYLKAESTVIDPDGLILEGIAQDSADTFSIYWLSKYKLTDRSYVFGELGYLDDNFDSFDEITSAYLGYGYNVLIGDKVNWDLSAGIGIRDTEYEDVTLGDVASESIKLGSIYSNKLTATTEFTNDTSIELGSDNTYVMNVSALTVAMSDNLALSLKYDVRHNTDPAPANTSTDKITSVNVVYNF